MKVLVLGVTGMLGSAVFKVLSDTYDVWGTLRDVKGKVSLKSKFHDKLISNVDVLDHDQLVTLLSRVRPSVIINCVGLIKQLSSSNDPLIALPINAMFPHRLAKLSSLLGARVIHISTDCVFSGDKMAGSYLESDVSDANDLYGKSKYIGELHDYSHCITLRTSIIGHEFNSNKSLIDWFLSQDKQVRGYTKAIFSGLPTAELARIIGDYVIPNSKLSGLYHVSAEPIDKNQLLKIVSEVYGKNIKVLSDDSISINRALDSNRFKKDVGYKSPSWKQLIKYMYENR